MAVVIQTNPFSCTAEECPRPGMFAFHKAFLSRDQVLGNFPQKHGRMHPVRAIEARTSVWLEGGASVAKKKTAQSVDAFMAVSLRAGFGKEPCFRIMSL